MQTIEEQIEKYIKQHPINVNQKFISAEIIAEIQHDAFLAGVGAAQQWISVDEELPEDTQDILMKDEDWENEYCPNGVRLGWYNPTHCKYYTSLWDDNKEEFVTRESTPTHWSPIELK